MKILSNTEERVFSVISLKEMKNNPDKYLPDFINYCINHKILQIKLKKGE